MLKNTYIVRLYSINRYISKLSILIAFTDEKRPRRASTKKAEESKHHNFRTPERKHLSLRTAVKICSQRKYREDGATANERGSRRTL